MLQTKKTEIGVGLFLLAALAGLIFLSMQVSGLTSIFQRPGYTITADFDDIGQLKIRGSVKIGGVTIGQVSSIAIDPVTYKAVVTLRIDNNVEDIPDDSSASILTAGLLGDNYVAITPLYSKTFFHNGGHIQDTHSAMILEKLIGQFLFSINHGKTDKGNAK